MPRIKTELAKGIEPEALKNYTIDAVTLEKTQVQGFSGYRVVMSAENKADENEYATMLWDRPTASIRSKIGSFLHAFTEYFEGDEDKANDTDNWIGAKIRVLSWADKNREIRVIDKP